MQVISQFSDIQDVVSLHLVEISPKLSEVQAERLCRKTANSQDVNKEQIDLNPQQSKSDTKRTNYGTGHVNHSDFEWSRSLSPSRKPYKSLRSNNGRVMVHWYQSIRDLPPMQAVYLAHEFFDALPIHKFQVKEGL